jgi:diaminopimelate epimerase
VRFTKMQGLGNDFVVLEGIDPDPGLVRRLCDRRLGVGADGVLVVDPRPTMRYWNADGSVAEMCGNGLRCVARYAVDREWAPAGEWFMIDTAVGPRRALVTDSDVTVEIGRVSIAGTVTIAGRSYHEASVGNPHAVAIVDDPDAIAVGEVGPLVERDVAFPEGANVEFVARVAPNRLHLRVWERGVGETLACGSGMVVAAAVAAGMGEEPIEVVVPGGVGRVVFQSGSGYLTGPAETAFTGEWPTAG